MNVKEETRLLAISKGYTQCTCSCGGYPECICDREPLIISHYSLQAWLRQRYIIVLVEWDTVTYGYSLFNPYESDCSKTTTTKFEWWGTYEEALEHGLVEALDLIN